jgi:DNA-binding CsgD family transcriptional regulator
VSELISGLLDSTRLLFDLQRGNEIAQSFSGCLEPDAIARCVTDGLVAKFGCAFARIWLLEPDKVTLRLVASSGLYTHLNGSFARVPMGAFKVGKIAQNRVPFLSNNLADETWVKDREWAIANNIRGFAGYPLVATEDRVIGVLATFSYDAMAPEFLEVLQSLCIAVTVALDTASHHQQEKKSWQATPQALASGNLSLSDQLAHVLHPIRLTLVGTEQPLTLSLTYIFLQVANLLKQLQCSYCRLTYHTDSMLLEAIVKAPDVPAVELPNWIRAYFGDLFFTASCLGGTLQTQMSVNQTAVQVLLKVPYPSCTRGIPVRIRCRMPVLHMAFIHLAYQAGLSVSETEYSHVPLVTDDVTLIHTATRVLWIRQPGQAVPKGITASLDLSIEPMQLRAAVEATLQGQPWGLNSTSDEPQLLSEREQEIMTLLAQGLRDRDIANTLIISESTVKFHINNVLSKLKARTRYQALCQAIVNGWIQTDKLVNM